MKNLFILLGFAGVINLAGAQPVVHVKFLYNNKALVIEKELVNFSPKDTIRIIIESNQLLSLDEVRVQPFYAKYSSSKSSQQQSQREQKVKLVVEDYKKFRGVNNQKKIVVTIPVRSFTGHSLSKLKINFINCTNQKGDKLIRNNKAYEIFSPLGSRAML